MSFHVRVRVRQSERLSSPVEVGYLFTSLVPAEEQVELLSEHNTAIPSFISPLANEKNAPVSCVCVCRLTVAELAELTLFN